ncbi:MAG: hypothetical protein IID45_06505 [Planctomycetes bacterium]|nr:hypothetical protein [Planctomycetota bacterium]
MESRVIGVREDPLRTYGETFRRYFPHGVTPNEAGFALDVLRMRKAIDIGGVYPGIMPLRLRRSAPAAPGRRLQP